MPATSTPSTIRTRRLRQFLPATISRAATAASADEKADIDRRRGDAADHSREQNRDTARSHSSASAASGQPLTGSRPVQFGMAVSRKPAMVAAT